MAARSWSRRSRRRATAGSAKRWMPWQPLRQEVGAEVRYAPVTGDSRMDLDGVESELAAGPKLLAITAISNVLGSRSPLPQIIHQAHAAGAFGLVNGAQAVPLHRV